MLENAPPSPGEVRALATQLLSWADQLAARHWSGYELSEDNDDLLLALAVAGREISRRRSRIFSGTAVGNPQWDVLIDLFVQEANGYRVSLDHLALAGELRAEIVYDSVERLVKAGLVERADDRFDKRTSWLSLTSKGKQGMTDFFTETANFVRPCMNRDDQPETV